MDRQNEYCVRCGDPTGRAGNYEDSLFLIIDGETVGPLCDDDYWQLKKEQDEQEDKRLFGENT